MRIGELAAARGSADLLRAWERRDGLLRPARSEAATGYIQRKTTPGCAPWSATWRPESPPARGAPGARGRRAERPSGPPVPGFSAELRAAVDRFDDTGAKAALDCSIGALSFDAVAREVILPYCGAGDRWERGEASVAQEHFASNVIRGRVLALALGGTARSSPRGAGLRARRAARPWPIVFGLPCATGEERHVPRRRHSGRDVAAAAEQLQPDAVVVVAFERGGLSRSGRRSKS